jgi:hypothetical protein
MADSKVKERLAAMAKPIEAPGGCQRWKRTSLRSLSLSTFLERPAMACSIAPGRRTPSRTSFSTASDHLQPTMSSTMRAAGRRAGNRYAAAST